MKKAPKKIKIIDVKNKEHLTDGLIGQGGQGKIYALENGKYIAKLFNSSDKKEELKSRINFLIQLELNKKIFATPLRQISQPTIGYISEFASGMKPLSILKPRKEDKEDLAAWYKSTGGLKRRYEVLKNLAFALRKLHARGLIYCDLSLNNVFVSEEKTNIFLIDLDNLSYKSNLLNIIFTPFYGAPELINKTKPNSTFSDAYSFAVIAYELLTFNHPLIGDLVSEGEPEMEEEALAGKHPWVDHSEDDANHRSTGLPSHFVITEKLSKLFKLTFEDGLNKPFLRPSLAQWYEALERSLHDLLLCGNEEKCGGSHYPFPNQKACPFCGYKPNHLTKISMRRWEEIEKFDSKTSKWKRQLSLDSRVLEEILIDKNTPKNIRAGDFLLGNMPPNKIILTISYLKHKGEDKILLSPKNEMQFFISPRTGKAKKKILLTKDQKIQIVDSNTPNKVKYMLHLKSLKHSQRVLTID